MNNPGNKVTKLERKTPNTETTEIGLLRDKIIELVLKSPQKAAVILSSWIKESVKKQQVKKAG
jgi:hypothetical protein